MGSLIIREVVNELLTKGLDSAKVLLLAGSSAGGTGVLVNVDHVAEQLDSLGHRGVRVRGLADSGWFLDNKQHTFTDCLDTISCAPTEAIKRGVRYWGGLVPDSCRRAHLGEEWRCFFGYNVFPTLKSPVFVVQWLFDEAQLTLDNIHLTGRPVNEGHDWMDIQVKGTSLPRALHCWDRSLQDQIHSNGSNRHRHRHHHHHQHHHHKHRTPPARGCPLHLIDSCPWPHCNPSCPTIRDQLTGQEMSVIQFLKHMGFDVQKMAQQQGMDPNKLLGMLNNGS
ncbi:Palmitoleoyl-protein carboxylesterase notum1a [Liparis tanakae]|uniref:Palmitoleoyl-protein carboxylesterase notum1a n=1 Tax=Liparis tanakae TaxID=230148 RepID=A0A4Z2HNP4_9TELE|nr:Palmitoleoyl-protein carboxylesterase notum1a [Liparis tanakae]